KRSA
ncbi:Catalyzes the cleavage of p-aminobenzoyl-glutamate to p-aminobenzoate and glutamate2C subunit A, partial [Terribacillus sp. AE2B 122]